MNNEIQQEALQTRKKFIISTAPYLLTLRCRVLLEKLTGLQLVTKLPAFHGTRRFITALTSYRHLSLTWASTYSSILTYPTVQSPSWEANWFAASHEITRISRNPKVHYCTHKLPPPVSNLGQHLQLHKRWKLNTISQNIFYWEWLK